MIFRDVELELVRPGPPHNQLLSPLTQYIALCGESSPITFRIDFEHRRLLTRLEQLRYKERADSRQRALAELGEKSRSPRWAAARRSISAAIMAW